MRTGQGLLACQATVSCQTLAGMGCHGSSARVPRRRRGICKLQGAARSANISTQPFGVSQARLGAEWGAKLVQGTPAAPNEEMNVIPEVCMSLVDVASDVEECNKINVMLESNRAEQEQALAWILPHALQMSMASRCSSRVVQRCLEVSGSEARDQMLAALLPGTLELYKSEHGNFVLGKAIEVAPRPHLSPIIAHLELEGGCVVAKHRCGCRILERLIEHGTDGQMSRLVGQCIEHAEELSRHQYGNFVIQSVLEHGTDAQGVALLEKLLPCVHYLSMHRSASHVVQKAINHCSIQGKRAIAHALLRGQPPRSFVDVAGNRYGSYVVEELQEISGLEAEICKVRFCLEEGLALSESPYLARTASKYGLLPKEEAEEEPEEEPEEVANQAQKCHSS